MNAATAVAVVLIAFAIIVAVYMWQAERTRLLAQQRQQSGVAGIFAGLGDAVSSIGTLINV